MSSYRTSPAGSPGGRRPQTPPQGYASRNRLTVRPSFPETFLDDITPNNNATFESHDDERDPHDLSLNPKHVARNSVVDNMLLSLDQFSPLESNFVEESYSPRQENSSVTEFPHYSSPGRYRSHTISSSVSSDVERYSGAYMGRQHSPGYRSNLNSGVGRSSIRQIHGSMERIDKAGMQYKNYDYEGSMRLAHQASHLLKSESAEEFHDSRLTDQKSEFLYNNGEPRRSASLDYGTRAFSNYNGARQVELPAAALDYDDINAAPTPTVPAGPRRNYSPTVNQFATTSTHQPPVLARKASSKSTRSLYNRPAKSNTLGTATIRGRNSDLNRRFPETRIEIPPVPSFSQSTAPSPTISRHNKPSNPMLGQNPETAAVPQAPKERQGFFKRVFGSAKFNPPAAADRNARLPVHEVTGSKSGHHSAPSSSKGLKHPQRDIPSSENTHHNHNNRENPAVLTKKSSYFFRRRKKQLPNPPPPLVLSHSNLTSMSIAKEEAPVSGHSKSGNDSGSISSLRNVVKQYLDQPFPSSPTRNESEKESAGDLHHRRGGSGKSELSRKPDQSAASSVRGRSRGDSGTRLEVAETRNGGGGGGVRSSFTEDFGDKETSTHPIYKYNEFRRPKTSPNRPSHQLPVHRSDSLDLDKQLQAIGISDGSSLSLSGVSTRSHTRSQRSHTQESLIPARIDESDYEDDATNRSSSVLPAKVTGKSSDRSLLSTASKNKVTPAIHHNDSGEPDWIKQSIENSAEVAEVLEEEPSEEDKHQAQKLFEGTEDEVIMNMCTAAWFGTPNRSMIRKAYMALFDWSEMNILAALRSLCSRVALKGETQQIDRVLDAFSSRWCESNANHGFKATDVVHTICYSVLLLNTDLHLADIDQKMTRSQFIKNTMPTIQRVVADAAPDAFKITRQSTGLDTSLAVRSPGLHPGKPNTAGSDGSDTTYRAENVGGPLVSAPFFGNMKLWEVQVESVLKEFYMSILKQKLPLRGISEEKESLQPSNTLLSLTGNMLRRTPSTLSRSGASDTIRGRGPENRGATARWSSKPRSRPRIYPSSTLGSSRTSLDDLSSVFSPTGSSSTWSKISLGKTLASASVDSLSSEYPRGDYQQSIGFANALSHAIIREDSSTSISLADDSSRAEAVFEDETLELTGAPWAKEGSLKHKHHLDSVDKRARDRNWNESFAVIQRGWMRLFSFNSSSKSMRLKPKQRQNAGLIVGGGNWMENAEEIWKFVLRHTIASALPAPGYSKLRPHVWALSLPTGAVHLFQVGTPEIVKEFVSTANFWSARLSKEPLFGAISNIEYGWGDSVINSAIAINPDESRAPSACGPRPSFQSSIRSSLDQQGVRPRLPADRVVITEWKPPQQSMMGVTVTELEQLDSLRTYVKHIEGELTRHNELRGAMVLAFSPRHNNYTKALTNWERKSSYLLREIVKFRTYIDSLQSAIKRREQIHSEQAATEEEKQGGEEEQDRPHTAEEAKTEDAVAT